MGFKVVGAAKNESSGDKPKVNFDDVNKYRVETAGLQKRETLVGVVAGIIDLGLQEQPDAEFPFDGTKQDEQDAIDDKPGTYFKDVYDPVTKKTQRCKCWTQRPVQAVVLAIDFPDITLDIGKFYGNSNPKPLRMFTGAQFWNGTKMVVARPTYLKTNKSLGDWSFDPKHLLHKMAVSSKLIEPTQCFNPVDIDQLLGKAFQFEAQVYFKESKGKEYYTEYLKFQGGLGRGQKAPVLEDEPFSIEFDGDLTPEKMQNLRSHVINTIKQANNYEGSKIQEYLENGSSSSKPAEQNTKKETPAKVSKPSKVVVPDDLDDEIPF